MRYIAVLFVLFAFQMTLSGQQPATVSPWAEKLFKDPKDANDARSLIHDFGSVARGAQLHYQFPMINVFAEPLEIAIRVGCGCVTATSSTKEVQPREKGTIDVTMDTRQLQGPKTVEIFVTVGPRYVSTAKLVVSANTRVDVVLNPGEINFGIAEAGKPPPELTLDVEYAGPVDWRILGVQTDNVPVNTTFKEIYRRPGQVGYRVSVSLKSTASPGPLKNEFFIKTNDPAGSLIPIPVAANIQAPLVVTPELLSFEKLKIGQVAEKSVMAKAAKPFHVLGIDGLSDGLTADLPARESSVHVIRLKCVPTKEGPIHKQLVIKTDLPKDPQIKLTVEATVER
jgi:hypothetical protein